LFGSFLLKFQLLEVSITQTPLSEQQKKPLKSIKHSKLLNQKFLIRLKNLLEMSHQTSAFSGFQQMLSW